ncbi:FSH1-domain-containing protein [Lentinus brumalis]|uniref:FSH1-domain-containing protein n=1 Tax=Lentinus brumalis TaxID=2498619 RepID=A0A371D875_9APHY|nr:FSH1-domain-containing protein [Polyporus brumalis]
MSKKVLVLHGYAQNALIFSKRMSALRKACGKDIELVFVDAPHVLTPADLAAAFNKSEESSLNDLGAPEASTDSDPALAPRGWWKTDAARTKTVGLEDSILYLRDILRTDHYEGIFGFSQGAGMAAIMAALLEKPEVFPPFLVDGKPPHPPVTFCISAAGFRQESPLCDSIFLPCYSTPTLHIIGRADTLVSEDKSQRLVDISANKRVEYHDGGHFVPSKASWRNFLKAYMKDPLGDVPPPAPATESQPASGAATPMTPSA